MWISLLNVFSVKEACKQPKLYCKVFNCSEPRSVASNSKSFEAGPAEFPFVVALYYGLDPEALELQCSGVLVSELYVLTACQCVTLDNQPVLVKLGKVNTFI